MSWHTEKVYFDIQISLCCVYLSAFLFIKLLTNCTLDLLSVLCRRRPFLRWFHHISAELAQLLKNVTIAASFRTLFTRMESFGKWSRWWKNHRSILAFCFSSLTSVKATHGVLFVSSSGLFGFIWSLHSFLQLSFNSLSHICPPLLSLDLCVHVWRWRTQKCSVNYNVLYVSLLCLIIKTFGRNTEWIWRKWSSLYILYNLKEGLVFF